MIQLQGVEPRLDALGRGFFLKTAAPLALKIAKH
jgi:hypothetical protein